MTDISKCKGDNCPIKDKCHRYTSSAADYQSYVIKPYEIENGVFSCDLFWGNEAEGIWKQLKDIMR